MTPDDVDGLLRAIWRAMPTRTRVVVAILAAEWMALLLWGLTR